MNIQYALHIKADTQTGAGYQQLKRRGAGRILRWWNDAGPLDAIFADCTIVSMNALFLRFESDIPAMKLHVAKFAYSCLNIGNLTAGMLESDEKIAVYVTLANKP